MNDKEWKYLHFSLKSLGGEGEFPLAMKKRDFLSAVRSMTDGYIATASRTAEQRAKEISIWHRKAFVQKYIEAARQKALNALARAEAWLAIDIHKLARDGNSQAVLAAIELGADQNEKDEKGWTPLMYSAAFNNNPDTTQVLIQSGADINDRVEFELMMLIHYDPDVSKETILFHRSNCWTPLMCAVVFNTNPRIIKQLIDSGADINARDNFGQSLNKETENKTISRGRTVLMLASHHTTNAEIIHTLINSGANISDRDDNGWTALMHAAEGNQNHLIIKALVTAGSDIEAKNIFGATALDIAKNNNKSHEVINTLTDLEKEITSSK